MKMNYPSWRYHATEPAKIVKTPDEDALLGAGWYHSPADAELDAATVPAAPTAGEPIVVPVAESLVPTVAAGSEDPSIATEDIDIAPAPVGRAATQFKKK